MGLYDSFIAWIRCPYCGKGFEAEFQTKALECAQKIWEIGDKVELSDLEIKEGIIRNCVASHCCDGKTYRFIIGDIVIKDGVFVGVLNIRKEEESL